MGLYRAQIIDRDSGCAPLFYRDLRDVGFLIFQIAFYGRGLPRQYSGNPVWVDLRVLCEGDGDGHPVSWCFQAFVLLWLSLAVCCAFSERQSSSGRISASVTEQRGLRAVLH